MKKTIFFLSVMMIAFVLGFINLNSQPGNFRLSCGLATIDILGENYSTLPLIYNSTDGLIRGGGFSQTQSGIRLETIFPLNEYERFEIPIGLEYVFFRAKEKSVTTKTGSQFTYHDKDIAFLTLGLNYNIFIFDAFIAIAKLYTGVDARLAIIQAGEVKVVTDFPAIDEHSVDITPSKGSVRLGTNLNMGINGELTKEVLVDLKCGIGIMNLVGQNDDNGELLTYYKAIEYTEKKESFVWSFNLAMSLQYNF